MNVPRETKNGERDITNVHRQLETLISKIDRAQQLIR